MGILKIQDTTLQNIADAIREGLGITNMIPTVEMANDIRTISSGAYRPKFVNDFIIVHKNDSSAWFDANTNSLNCNNVSSITINPIIDYSKSWKVHIRFSVNSLDFSTPKSLLGCNGSNYKAPSVQCKASTIWFGYSYDGKAWNISVDVPYTTPLVVDKIYEMEYEYDGASQLHFKVWSEDEIIAERTVNIAGAHYMSSYKMAIGKNWSFSYSFNGKIYIDNTYIINDDQVIFGREDAI